MIIEAVCLSVGMSIFVGMYISVGLYFRFLRGPKSKPKPNLISLVYIESAGDDSYRSKLYQIVSRIHLNF